MKLQYINTMIVQHPLTLVRDQARHDMESMEKLILLVNKNGKQEEAEARLIERYTVARGEFREAEEQIEKDLNRAGFTNIKEVTV